MIAHVLVAVYLVAAGAVAHWHQSEWCPGCGVECCRAFRMASCFSFSIAWPVLALVLCIRWLADFGATLRP